MNNGCLGGELAEFSEGMDQWLRLRTPVPVDAPTTARHRREIEIKRRIDLRTATPAEAWWSASPPRKSAAAFCQPGDERLN